MRPSFVLLAALSTPALAALSTPALAEGGAPRDPIAVVEHIFETADRDGSGTLSPAEYAHARLERFGVRFADCDADGDGEASLSEYLDVYLRFHPSADRSRI